MKKFWFIALAIIILAAVAFFGYQWFFKKAENNDSNNYYASRVGINTENTTNHENNINKQPVEKELYSYTTPLKDDRKNRVNNIKITCSRINNTTVKAGKEFSFCDTVGQPSADDGYKPADAFGSDGQVIQAIGGGNCQVSTTIYNAALGVKGLKITERHEHDRDVAYIKDGKDATVAYDYLDLKFKNNNDFDIKLYAFISDNNVCVKIFKIE